MFVLKVAPEAALMAPRKPPKEDDSLSWALEPAAAPTNGAIYQVGRDVALFENPVARHVGDIVTISLNESTAAKKSANARTTVHPQVIAVHESLKPYQQ